MDLLDAEIIRLLESDGRRSSTDLAKELHTSSATIRRRIQKLIKDDALRIVAFVNPSKIGRPLTAIICLKVETRNIGSIVEKLFEEEEITVIHSVIGRVDFVCFARFRDNDSLLYFLREKMPRLEGVTVVETFISAKSLMRPVSGDWPKGWKIEM